MTRQQANEQLVLILQDLVQKTPDLRFGQLLSSYGFVKENRPANPDQKIDWQNEFYTEPNVILERVKNRIGGING